MNIDKNTSVAFTGHRTKRILGISGNPHIIHNMYKDVSDKIEKLYLQGYRTYFSGMAEGMDLLAAKAVLNLKSKYADIRLVAVIPFKGQSAHFEGTDRLLYKQILQQTDETVILSDSYYTGCFHRRNDYLIDHSAVLVAYWDGQPKGGTYYTVSKARRMNKTIINLFK